MLTSQLADGDALTSSFYGPVHQKLYSMKLAESPGGGHVMFHMLGINAPFAEQAEQPMYSLLLDETIISPKNVEIVR